MATTFTPDSDFQPAAAVSEAVDLSRIMLCLNEAERLETCIREAQQGLRDTQVSGEIMIADNGSTHSSLEIAERLGARVVNVKAKGYGNALLGGIAAASGKYVVMGDADDSYDFGHIPRFLGSLRDGADLVMGNRLRGGIQKDAMPHWHQYFGNPALDRIGRLSFKSPVGDIDCELRGFRKDAYESMGLRTTGMEFATEMVVKATLLKLRIAEVPTTLSPHGRSRPAPAHLARCPSLISTWGSSVRCETSEREPHRTTRRRKGLSVHRTLPRGCGHVPALIRRPREM